MPVHKETRVLPYPCDRFFELVADVESYPEFLPLWRSARIYKRCENGYYTDQEVGLGLWLSQRFRSRTRLSRPTEIVVTSDDSLFENFRIHWQFHSAPENGCRVEFELSCDARSFAMRQIMDFMLLETARAMIEAFESRARKLYGPDAK